MCLPHIKFRCLSCGREYWNDTVDGIKYRDPEAWKDENDVYHFTWCHGRFVKVDEGYHFEWLFQGGES